MEIAGMFRTYSEAYDYLMSQLPMFQRQGGAALKTYDLTKIVALTAGLHHPERAFPSVHIAGTNGKGSSAHLLASILQAAGYRTGLYTSPHLRSFTERIRINGLAIGERQVVDYVNAWQPLLEEVEPSFFEMSVLMAFAHFADEKVDIAVVETGMGGKLDSTNVITPLVSLITNVSADHQQFLGTTLAAIAEHKAGIIKPGVPAVLGEAQPELRSVFAERARVVAAPLIDSTEQWQVRRVGEATYDILRGGQVYLSQARVGLLGHYQGQNLPGVMAVVEALGQQGWRLGPEAVRVGLEKVAQTGIKGRWQVLGQQPLTVADTGHNEEGLRALVAQVRATPHRHLHWVWGMVGDKDLSKALALLPRSAQYYFCQPEVPRALAVVELAQRAAAVGLAGQAYGSVGAALTAARAAADPEDLIMIGGSTFVVAALEEV